jgi:hypothetical protein
LSYQPPNLMISLIAQKLNRLPPRAPDFCKTTAVRKNEMTMMHQPQLDRQTNDQRHAPNLRGSGDKCLWSA